MVVVVVVVQQVVGTHMLVMVTLRLHDGCLLAIHIVRAREGLEVHFGLTGFVLHKCFHFYYPSSLYNPYKAIKSLYFGSPKPTLVELADFFVQGVPRSLVLVSVCRCSSKKAG